MIPSRLFRKDCESKCFTAEASDLTGYWRGGPITLVSDFGHTANFAVTEVVVTDDGNDFWYWVLKPTAEAIAKIPNLAGWSIEIFND